MLVLYLCMLLVCVASNCLFLFSPSDPSHQHSHVGVAVWTQRSSEISCSCRPASAGSSLLSPSYCGVSTTAFGRLSLFSEGGGREWGGGKQVVRLSSSICLQWPAPSLSNNGASIISQEKMKSLFFALMSTDDQIHLTGDSITYSTCSNYCTSSI